MMVHLHGFDWSLYTQRIMPAFALWLTKDEDQIVYDFYTHTRCFKDEQAVPEPMRSLCAWPRAQEFVNQLPRGPYARSEYLRLCIAEQFTTLSDHYVYRHPPQLYRESEALRTVWGAIIEQYCLPWNQQAAEQEAQSQTTISPAMQDRLIADREELLQLLQNAGLNDLARTVDEQSTAMPPAPFASAPSRQGADIEETTSDYPLPADVEDTEEDEEEQSDGPQGILLGRHPTTIYLRGWLSTISIRAMGLFELLACGRRSMPFGYQPGDPFGCYIGYLTPKELHQLALSLKDTVPVDRGKAEMDQQLFRHERFEQSEHFRLIDEVLPTHSLELVRAVQEADLQGLGLICSVG